MKMSHVARLTLSVSALVVVLFFATGAYADSFTVDFSGTAPDGTAVSGTLDLNATNDGGGVFSVTSITAGSLTLEGSSDTVSGLTPLDGIPSPSDPAFDAYYMCTSCDHYFGYDNLLFPTASPLVDDGGLLFNAGLGEPSDLYCASSSACFLGVWIGPDSVLAGLFPNGGNNTVDPEFEDYSVTLSQPAQSTPEPSSLLLLGVGLGLLIFAGFRHRGRFVGSADLA
jgi:hypothetical protein